MFDWDFEGYSGKILPQTPGTFLFYFERGIRIKKNFDNRTKIAARRSINVSKGHTTRGTPPFRTRGALISAKNDLFEKSFLRRVYHHEIHKKGLGLIGLNIPPCVTP